MAGGCCSPFFIRLDSPVGYRLVAVLEHPPRAVGEDSHSANPDASVAACVHHGFTHGVGLSAGVDAVALAPSAMGLVHHQAVAVLDDVEVGELLRPLLEGRGVGVPPEEHVDVGAVSEPRETLMRVGHEDSVPRRQVVVGASLAVVSRSGSGTRERHRHQQYERHSETDFPAKHGVCTSLPGFSFRAWPSLSVFLLDGQRDNALGCDYIFSDKFFPIALDITVAEFLSLEVNSTSP